MSPDLLGRLVAWNDSFNRFFSHESNEWVSEEVGSKWAADSEALVADLHSELDGRVILIVDPWPFLK